jgi:hypothetical protein
MKEVDVPPRVLIQVVPFDMADPSCVSVRFARLSTEQQDQDVDEYADDRFSANSSHLWVSGELDILLKFDRNY